MLVAIDCQPFVYRQSGGIVQWLGGIFETYAKEFPEDELTVFRPEDFPAGLVAGNAVHEISFPRRGFSESLSKQLRRRNYDTLLHVYPTIEQPAYPVDRRICFIPDMQHEEHPEFFPEASLRHRRLAFAQTLGTSGAIGTMTEYSKATILASPWANCQDVFLAPPGLTFAKGAEPDPEVNEAWRRELAAGPGYFYMPANVWPHKNHARLVEASAARV